MRSAPPPGRARQALRDHGLDADFCKARGIRNSHQLGEFRLYSVGATHYAVVNSGEDDVDVVRVRLAGDV